MTSRHDTSEPTLFRRKEVIGNCTLYLANTIEILPALSADVILTDPVWPNCPPGLKKARAAIIYQRPSKEIEQLISQWRREDATLTDIADKLNRLHLPTLKGFHWYASTVRAALERLPEFQKGRKEGNSKGRTNDFVISCRPPPVGLNAFTSGAIPSVVTPSVGRSVTIDGELTMADLAESFRMLDTFASVGATHFDVTFIDIDGEKCGFRKEQTARQLRNSLPHLLPGLTERHQNLIIRPYGNHVRFVQLDDLDYEQLKPLAPVSCLIIETSPGNHQAWVAVSDLDNAEAKDFARRLRKGVGADLTASGATRMAGTSNYKRKYEPEFPEVKVLQAAPGRQATKAELESLGLLAAPDPVYDAPASPIRVSGSRHWPDYERCVQGAPLNHSKTGPDISRADYFWALMAAQRGHSTEEIAGRLMQLSEKAKENGERYARMTAENAMEAHGRQRVSHRA